MYRNFSPASPRNSLQLASFGDGVYGDVRKALACPSWSILVRPLVEQSPGSDCPSMLSCVVAGVTEPVCWGEGGKEASVEVRLR